jgi:hypothetical protein
MQQHQVIQLDIDPATLIACPALPQPEDGQFNTLLANHVAVTHAYADCQQHHAQLITAITHQRGVSINGEQPAVDGDGAPASASSS